MAVRRFMEVNKSTLLRTSPLSMVSEYAYLVMARQLLDVNIHWGDSRYTGQYTQTIPGTIDSRDFGEALKILPCTSCWGHGMLWKSPIKPNCTGYCSSTFGSIKL